MRPGPGIPNRSVGSGGPPSLTFLYIKKKCFAFKILTKVYVYNDWQKTAELKGREAIVKGSRRDGCCAEDVGKELKS